MKKVLLPLAALLLGAAPAMAGANVYASALKAENGKISFILNDDATAVTLNILKDGKIVATAALGAGSKGLNTVDIPEIEAEAGTYNWSLTASAAAITEVTRLTDGTDTNLQTSSARGIAVDNHPASPAFGNIYAVSPATPGQAGARTEPGLYAFNAALAPINETAYTGGLDLETGSSSTPNNVAVADNGDVFICVWGDPQGGVYWLSPEDLSANWTSVFAEGERNDDGLVTIDGVDIHGSVQDLALYGSGDARMLYTSDEDMHGTAGDIMAYNIGTLATPWAKAPTADWGHPDGYVNANHRLASDGRGGLWLSQYRWQESAANACVYHLNDKGELDFQTGDKSVFLGSTIVGAMGVNADGSLMCVAGGDTGLSFTVASIAFGEDGIPALTKLYDVTLEAPYTGKRPFDVAFDAADNLYIVFNNADQAGGIAAWALPKEKNEYTTPANSTIDLEGSSSVASQIAAAEIDYAGGIITAEQGAAVYSATGAKVAEGTTIDTTGWGHGVYIVRSGAATLKISK